MPSTRDEAIRPATRETRAGRIQEEIAGISASRKVSSSEATCSGVVTCTTITRATVVPVTAKPCSPMPSGTIRAIAPIPVR